MHPAVHGTIAAAGVPTGYTSTANDYDGTNDYALRGAGLTGAASGKTGIISCWVRFDGGNGSAQRILNGILSAGLPHFSFLRTAGNIFEINGSTSGSSVILTLRSIATATAGATWYHLLASWDLNTAGARRVYLNDSDTTSQITFSNFTIDYTLTDWSIGATDSGTQKLNGCLSELFFHTSYLDLSVEANRRKFISATGKPVDLGANGSTPLGVQPLVYIQNGDPSTNAGSGGNFTNQSTLTACSSSPSD